MQDHPRSRGVYVSQSSCSKSVAGSSPLARGLPPRLDQVLPDGRIIPARAGFTRVLPGLHPHAADHPRSRGVYPVDQAQPGDLLGSSPLARGLQDTHHHPASRHRIIPARAGFTRAAPQRARERPDHPRSRGVYARSAAACPRAPGSSPLARGLQGVLGLRVLVGRIIPARAGFTATAWTSVTWPRDHPRSRGVYA